MHASMQRAHGSQAFTAELRQSKEPAPCAFWRKHDEGVQPGQALSPPSKPYWMRVRSLNALARGEGSGAVFRRKAAKLSEHRTFSPRPEKGSLP